MNRNGFNSPDGMWSKFSNLIFVYTLAWFLSWCKDLENLWSPSDIWKWWLRWHFIGRLWVSPIQVPYDSVSNTSDPVWGRFNSSLYRTRVLIEQTFGIMKRKFQALHFGLRTSPDQAVSCITACCILYNIGIERGDTIISGDCRELNVADCQQAVINAHPRADGMAKRTSITQSFFWNPSYSGDIIVDLPLTACH